MTSDPGSYLDYEQRVWNWCSPRPPQPVGINGVPFMVITCDLLPLTANAGFQLPAKSSSVISGSLQVASHISSQRMCSASTCYLPCCFFPAQTLPWGSLFPASCNWEHSTLVSPNTHQEKSDSPTEGISCLQYHTSRTRNTIATKAAVFQYKNWEKCSFPQLYIHSSVAFLEIASTCNPLSLGSTLIQGHIPYCHPPLSLK